MKDNISSHPGEKSRIEGKSFAEEDAKSEQTKLKFAVQQRWFLHFVQCVQKDTTLYSLESDYIAHKRNPTNENFSANNIKIKIEKFFLFLSCANLYGVYPYRLCVCTSQVHITI